MAGAATIIFTASISAQEPVKAAYRYDTDNSAVSSITLEVVSNRHGARLASIAAEGGTPIQLAFADVVRPAEDLYMAMSPKELFPGTTHRVLLMQALEDRESDRAAWHCRSDGVLYFGFEQAGAALPLGEFNPSALMKVWAVVHKATAVGSRMAPCIHLATIGRGQAIRATR